jgi:tetratricopeptide (TPR) repeat protein
MKTYGPANRDTNYCQFNYALALLAAGETAAARQQAQEGLNTRLTWMSPLHPQMGDAWEILGAIDLAMGSYPAAVEEFRKAIDIRSAYYGAQHVLVANAQIPMAEAMAREGQLTEAKTRAASALAAERANRPTDLSQLGLAEAALGRVELAGHHVSAALPLLEDAYQNVAATYGPNHPQTACVGVRLAQALAANGQTVAALQLIKKVSPVLISSRGGLWSQERTVAEKVRRVGSSALLEAIRPTT